MKARLAFVIMCAALVGCASCQEKERAVQTMHLPNDADGDALRRLLADGSDLSKPMDIDFHVAVPDGPSGDLVAKAVADAGFRTSLSQDDESGNWTCWCAKSMVPRYDDLIAAQELLDKLSHPYGGYSDGWGSFGNAAE